MSGDQQQKLTVNGRVLEARGEGGAHRVGVRGVVNGLRQRLHTRSAQTVDGWLTTTVARALGEAGRTSALADRTTPLVFGLGSLSLGLSSLSLVSSICFFSRPAAIDLNTSYTKLCVPSNKLANLRPIALLSTPRTRS